MCCQWKAILVCPCYLMLETSHSILWNIAYFFLPRQALLFCKRFPMSGRPSYIIVAALLYISYAATFSVHITFAFSPLHWSFYVSCSIQLFQIAVALWALCMTLTPLKWCYKLSFLSCDCLQDSVYRNVMSSSLSAGNLFLHCVFYSL